MNDFHDPELERLFGRNSGPTPDVDVAYQRVQGRVRQVKRRRAVVVSGAACSLLFAVAVFAGARSGGNNSVQPGGSGTGADGSPLTVADSSDLSVPTSDSSSTVSTTPDGTTLGTGTVTTVGNGATTVTSPTGSSVSTPSTAPGATSGSVPSSSVSTPFSSPATTTPATNPPAPITETFSGIGGSITVRLQNGSLTLVSYNAASGFTADVQKSSGDRVEVRFESEGQRTDIRVDIAGGSMSPRIDES